MFFAEKKIRKHVNEIGSKIYRETQDIPSFKYLEAECNGAHEPDFNDADWEDFNVGGYWGGYDKVAWFRTRVPVPKDWENQKVVFRFLVGPRDGGNSTAETLLYVNGKPLQAIDIWHEEAWVPPECFEKGEMHIALKAWSGVLGVPDRRHFKVAQLATVDLASEQYFYLADTILMALEELDEHDLRRTELLKCLNDSIHRVDFLKPGSEQYYESVQQAALYLQGKLDEFAEMEEMKPTVVALGHSHIDMAWLWRLKHTREKASRTFSTVLHLMKQYPEYRYIHTSPQLYQFLKTDYPEIYEKVKAKIRSGEWEITGGMWVEPDTNLPSGESLIRQLMFGKRFMKEEFGVETKVVWLPDVFGYTWALPQIMKKSGIDYFMTTKISWNQFNRFPYDTFNWRGIDGTEILTHFITTPEFGNPSYTYNGEIDPKSIKGIWNQYKQKDVNQELLLAYGWGDGGGGPTKEMLESRRVLKNLPGFPKVTTGKAEPYFERLSKRVADKDIPLWDGELYLEYHRGTYTSQASLKRANRKAEEVYHQAEWLSVMDSLLNGTANVSNEQLREGWERLLLNQFHDVLPGSSIRQVNEDARADYEWVQKIGKEVRSKASSAILNNIQVDSDSVVVFNSSGFERNDIINVPLNGQVSESQSIVGENGRISPVQVVNGEGEKKLLLKAENVPAFGYKTFRLVEGDRSQSESTLVVRSDYLENPYYEIRLNDRGQMVSVYDKRNQREVLAEHSRGNVFQAFEDKPMEFDAWDIDVYYQEKMREVSELAESQVIEEGPLRGTLRLKWTFYDSTIIQDLTIYKDSPRIDFKTEVEWQERQTLLKVAFPVDIRSTKATYDIQFGNIERPTHWNTSWDYARFEVVGHKWVDLSEGNYGVSLLNDCKYGHDVKDNVMRLTLIKSSISPDETADRGKHVFTYSLLPHAGDWKNGVVKEGYALNQPLSPNLIEANGNGSLPPEYRFIEVDADHVMIETVKKAEESDAIVIRLYEFEQNRNKNVHLSFGEPIQKAVECNLMEEDEKEVEWDQKQLQFAIAPYEIKTFKIWF